MVYETHEIERVAEVAFRAASFRKKRVTLADKANVLETSLLWRKVVRSVAARHPKITLDFIYADNAAMQLVRDPGRFDVLLCENLFGDMLSDQAAAVAGSLACCLVRPWERELLVCTSRRADRPLTLRAKG